MKTFTSTVFFLCITMGLFAQSQRLILLEEFTQASCAPCAAQNPALNELLGENDIKVVAIKYQTSWPGTDPMNAQNPSQVATRVSYYNVGGVPNIRLDGNVNSGLPSVLSQSGINTQYAVSSPFDLNISHYFDTNRDSIYISVDITATMAATYTGPLKAHVGLVEREIHFTNPPGNNGEKEFYNVMRKMYPAATGTTLQSTWAVNDVYNMTFAEALPSYIYNKDQIAVVVWIQDDDNKNVKQAAYSAPLGYDATIKSIENVPFITCDSSITPDVIIKNNSSPTITSATISYQVDANPVQTINWTGNLTFGSFETVALPSLPIIAGPNSISVSISDPNGQIDFGSQNNTKIKQVNNASVAVSTPILQDFQATAFPPVDWAIDNPDNELTWQKRNNVGGYSQSTSSAYINLWNYPVLGAIDYIYPPSSDLTGLATPTLYFDLAYAPYSSTYYDALQVQISTNCGGTWSTVYNKSFLNLATAPATTANFVPNATQWRTETINLNPFIGETILVRFASINGYGNNIYLDNIGISESITSVNEVNNDITEFSVYPNPITDNATIKFNVNELNDLKIEIFNTLGEVISTILNKRVSAGEQTDVFSTEKLNAGIYFITATSQNGTITRKITVVR